MKFLYTGTDPYNTNSLVASRYAHRPVKINVKQLGLKTGKIVIVRRSK